MRDLEQEALKPQEDANWSVWRIDDHGNTFVVREHLTHADAERLVAEYAARGHKQTYWAEREDEDEGEGEEKSEG